jgi:S-(hydroxymethyl)glutathione dehydrogenase / alcohol dehydrogenase
MCAELYLQGHMNPDDLASKRISLPQLNDGYATLKDGSLRP